MISYLVSEAPYEERAAAARNLAPGTLVQWGGSARLPLGKHYLGEGGRVVRHYPRGAGSSSIPVVKIDTGQKTATLLSYEHLARVGFVTGDQSSEARDPEPANPPRRLLRATPAEHDADWRSQLIPRPLPPRIPGQDYGTDPVGDGIHVRMVPSGDIVTIAEARVRRGR